MKKITVKTIKSHLKKMGVKPTKKNINYYAKELYKLKKSGKLKKYDFSESLKKLSGKPKNFIPKNLSPTITTDVINEMLPKKYGGRYDSSDYIKMYDSFNSYMGYYMTGKERKTLNKLFKGLSKEEIGKFIVGLLDKTGLSFNELMYGKNGRKYEKNAINQLMKKLANFTDDKKLKKQLKSIEGII